MCAGGLYKEFAGTKSMSGWVQIKVEKVKANTPGMYYSKDSDGVTIAKALALFDSGSDGAGVTAVFARNHKLSKLPTKSLSLRTVNGVERKSFNCEKLEILTRWHEGYCGMNTDNLELKCVGVEIKLEAKYIKKVCALFNMDESL